MTPLDKAIELYDSLIDELSDGFSGRNFCAIGDPCFEGFRFYSLDQLDGGFDFDQAVELGEASVDHIEEHLIAAGHGYSLFSPVLSKLNSISLQLNKRGTTVFLGAWAMGPGEIGWCVRYLNDRPLFTRYLSDAGIIEADVDAYNAAYTSELN